MKDLGSFVSFDNLLTLCKPRIILVCSRLIADFRPQGALFANRPSANLLNLLNLREPYARSCVVTPPCGR